MAITHTKDNQLNSAPVKVSNYIRIILALALSGLAELASLFFIQPLYRFWLSNMMCRLVR